MRLKRETQGAFCKNQNRKSMKIHVICTVLECDIELRITCLRSFPSHGHCCYIPIKPDKSYYFLWPFAKFSCKSCLEKQHQPSIPSRQVFTIYFSWYWLRPGEISSGWLLLSWMTSTTDQIGREPVRTCLRWHPCFMRCTVL